jgi:hypothetical protein
VAASTPSLALALTAAYPLRQLQRRPRLASRSHSRPPSPPAAAASSTPGFPSRSRLPSPRACGCHHLRQRPQEEEVTNGMKQTKALNESFIRFPMFWK